MENLTDIRKENDTGLMRIEIEWKTYEGLKLVSDSLKILFNRPVYMNETVQRLLAYWVSKEVIPLQEKERGKMDVSAL